MFYSETRITHDVDIVVWLRLGDVHEVVESFTEPDYYLSVEAILKAMEYDGSFNIIYRPINFTIDLIHAPDTEFNRSRFSRVRPWMIEGVPVMLSSPEDIILMKLVYYHEGGSEKHNRDIASMFKVSGDQIDRNYIERWAPILGVQKHWDDMKERLAAKQ